MIYHCEICKTEIKDRPSHPRRFCSIVCKQKSPDMLAWAKYLGSHYRDRNPGVTGHKMTKESRLKMRLAKLGKIPSKEIVEKRRQALIANSENRKDWKGDDVGYSGLHKWVYVRLGKIPECMYCGTDESLQWANISGKYKRDLLDWVRLCAKCHRDYDSNVIGLGRMRAMYG